MGVEVRLNTLAVDMDHHSVTTKGPDGVETIPARTRIWAAGVQASPLASMLAHKAGLAVDRAGRIPVQPDCTLAGHPEVFAIGDMVSLGTLPGVAQPAIQEGKYAANDQAGWPGTALSSRSGTSTRARWRRSGTGPRWRTRSG